MSGEDAAYENTWRATPWLLWAIAAFSWILGAVVEAWLPGSFAASGGIAIALTAPLLGTSFSKQSAYELDLKLALLNLRRENNLGAGTFQKLPADFRPKIADMVANNDKKINELQSTFNAQRKFSGQLLVAESWIIGFSSAIAALGAWIGNVLFHCGSVSC